MSQPVPIAYPDLGKASNDLLGKDYPVGAVKLEVKTTAPNGVTFTVNGAKDSKTGAIHSELKTKWTDAKNGISFTESWNTANLITGQIELENNLSKGLKLDINASLQPSTSAKTARIGAVYKQSGLHTRGYLDLVKGSVFTTDAVVYRDGVLAGAEVAYDVQEGKVKRYNTAIGYVTPEYALTLHAQQNLSVFSASYYHRVSPTVEAGGRAVWDSKTANSNVALEVGTKYFLDKDAFVKAKVNNNGILGLSYTQLLRPGVKVTLGGSFDTSRVNENAHKFGLAFTVDA
ncbi:uncharacterized protein VTP21DRAFT_8547 [Calcarisporiella thermophila]|uniref:uncharacterized protein n=1 Tax=Calcarisporiella thermophila TaxID=911321 RepID=UPI0037424CA3